MRRALVALVTIATTGACSHRAPTAAAVADAAPATTAAPASPPAPPTAAEMRPLVDAAARPLVDGGWAPGLVVVLIDEHADTTLSYGAVRPGGPPPDADTLFEIGSVTKVFTSLVLAREVEAGHVTLDTPVATLLPKGTRVPSRSGREITLVDLSTHRSGLPKQPADFAPADPDDPFADFDLPKLYAFLATYQLPRAPGAAYDYSNLGAALLGDALALHAGQPYEQMVQDGILTPLGLTSTSFDPPAAERARLAQGHDADGREIGRWHFAAITPAGGLCSDARDLARLVRAEMGLLPGDGAAGLRTAIDATQVIHGKWPPYNVGLAWHFSDGKQVIWHNGQTGGYHTFVGFDRARRRGLVILASEQSLVIDEIAFYLLRHWRGLPAAAPELPASITVDDATLAGYVGTYQLTPAMTISVTRDGARLYVQLTGQQAFVMWPSAPDHFALRAVDAKFEFERDHDGQVVAVVLVQNGARQRAPRQPAAQSPGER